MLTGGRLTVEDAYAYAKFARLAARTNDVDFRARPHSAEELDFLAAHVVGDRPEPTYADLSAAPGGGVRGVRARGGVADRVPAAAPGRPQPAPRCSTSASGARPRRAQDPAACCCPAVPGARGGRAGRASRRRGRRAVREGCGDPGRGAGSRGARAVLRRGGARRADRGRAGLGAAAGRRARRAGGRCRAEPAAGRAAGQRRRGARRGGAGLGSAGARLPAEPGRDTEAILAAAGLGELGALVVAGSTPATWPTRRPRSPRCARSGSWSASRCGPARSPSWPTWCCRSRRTRIARVAT